MLLGPAALAARGKTKEYVENLFAVPVDSLARGMFIMAGGGSVALKGGRRRLRVAVICGETGLGYDVLDWARVRAGGGAA